MIYKYMKAGVNLSQTVSLIVQLVITDRFASISKS